MTESETQALRTALNNATALREELNQATEQLNKGITAVEAQIKALRLGVAARVPITETLLLGWGKLDNAWRLLLVRVGKGEEEIEPLTNSTRWIRLLAVKHLPALVGQLASNVTEEIKQVQQRASDLDHFVEALKKMQEEL